MSTGQLDIKAAVRTYPQGMELRGCALFQRGQVTIGTARFAPALLEVIVGSRCLLR